MSRYYRRKRYYRHQNSPLEDIFEGLFEIIIFLGAMLGKLIYKLFMKLFHNKEVNVQPWKNESLSTTHPEVTPKIVEAPIYKEEEISPKYGLKTSLLTDSEKNFLLVLREIVGDRYQIVPQVQLQGIVSPADSKKYFDNYSDFNRIKSKSIDFVLYDENFKPYVAIELDDRTHYQWKRRKRDALVNEIMDEIGLRLVHIKASYSYNKEFISRVIFSDKGV